MRGVRSASVLVSLPREQGFGTTHVAPSASVSIWMDGSQRVSDNMVDSIARLVAGSVAEMSPQSVSVTDANYGRTRTIKDEDEVLPGEMLEYVQHRENLYQKKISNMLSYIPGVMVAVNVRVSDVSKEQAVEYGYTDTEPLTHEESEDTVRRRSENGGAPGAESNAGATIAGGGGATIEEQTSHTATDYGEKPLVSQTHITRSGHTVQQVNVSINVPRKFFVQIYKANNPKAKEPTDQDLQSVVNQQLQYIQDQVQPVVLAENQGVVRAHMVPDETLVSSMANNAPTSGAGMLQMADWLQPVSVGVLALASLVFMLSMVRKATKKEELPSVDELAGVPAALEADDELYGDVDDTEAAMAGVELNEDEIKSRKITEQLNEMVKENPAEAGQLLGRWVQKRQ